ncbi:DUF3313 domain-containing protein [Pararobbsia silviterrae]|uniref:DUF3313 domain-containing protein n=1 Tax=Pararobbsia silviterrae TaxID=1792498 RepID=A0A494XPK5_9BURK|nr:DUF3313 domain-containing protein [Pararobbsia silviterrae]RKP51742.1 DUF3313 domain-containing protein [Pararobbsia silviterrae]
MHSMRRRVRRLIIIASFSLFPVLSNVRPPNVYSGIGATVNSVSSTHAYADASRIPLRELTPIDWFKYDRLVIDPVEVYGGADSQFVGIDERGRRQLATYMRRRFATTLARRFELTSKCDDSSCLQLRLILAGAENSARIASALAWIDVAGGGYNGLQALNGGQAAFSGSVSYAVELYDASTNRLLVAYVAEQYPSPFNVRAVFDHLGAPKAGIDKAAEALLASFR